MATTVTCIDRTALILLRVDVCVKNSPRHPPPVPPSRRPRLRRHVFLPRLGREVEVEVEVQEEGAGGSSSHGFGASLRECGFHRLTAPSSFPVSLRRPPGVCESRPARCLLAALRWLSVVLCTCLGRLAAQSVEARPRVCRRLAALCATRRLGRERRPKTVPEDGSRTSEQRETKDFRCVFSPVLSAAAHVPVSVRAARESSKPVKREYLGVCVSRNAGAPM